MESAKNILLSLLVALGLTSCLISDYTRTTNIEIMKPGIFNIPENVKTVALINRVSSLGDTIPFRYFNGAKIETDSTVKYQVLSNICVDALAGFLEKEGYF